MATPKPLTLRRQRATPSSGLSKNHPSFLQAEVLVDTGVYHLGDPYSYFIPEELSETIRVGSVVNVPFATGNTTGIVLKIGSSERAGLKTIDSVTQNHAIQSSLLELAEKLTENAICNPFDIYRNVLPLTTKGSITQQTWKSPSKNARQVESRYVQAGVGENIVDILLERCAKNAEFQRLLVFPTAREVKTFSIAAQEKGLRCIEYGSHLSMTERKRAFSEIVSTANPLVIGTRSAIFAPLGRIDEIIVVDEWSEHYFEQRSPYWNLRDVAFMRAKIESCNLFFLSSSASLELVHYLDIGKVEQTRRARLSNFVGRVRVTCAPSSYLSVVRHALKSGPVLVTVAEKNFSNLFICQRCRSVARCACGGRIIMTKRGEFSCSLCSLKNRSWRCKECGSAQFIIMKSGIEKVKEELSKSIPNVPVYTSTQEKEISTPIEGSVIIVATSGMEPTTLGGYSAIILLDGEHIVSRPLVRSEEDALQRWFKTLQLLRKNGEIFVSLPSNHRITQSIIASDPLKYLRNEKSERQRLGLPPSRTAIKIESKGESLSSLRNRLMKQFPSLTIHLSSDAYSAIVLADSETLRECLVSIKALQKVRSMQSKSAYKIIVNPYHL